MPSKKIIILIVDDANINLAMLKNIITQHIDCDTITASSGQEVFNQLNECLPDIILLDVILPDINGFEVAKIIKNNPVTKDIPIIFITSLSDEESKIKAFESGGIDYLTKPFSSKEVIQRISAQLKLKHQFEEIKKLNKRIMYDVAIAKKIQTAIMPEKELIYDNIMINCRYVPFEYIGGDFFDIIQIDKNVFFVFLIDITGHGISAALYTMMIKSNLYYLTKNFNSPADILNQLNNDISELLLDDFYPTGVLLKIDLNNMTMSYSNAGHPAPVFFSDDSVIELTNKNFSLALKPDVKMSEETININKGDKIYIYTDGILQLDNPESVYLEKALFMNIIKDSLKTDMRDQIDSIIRDIKKNSKSGFFQDDVTLIGIQIV